MLVLITYDVNTETAAGRARLRKVAKQCVNYGRRVQNSVFECILDNTQCLKLKSILEDIIDTGLTMTFVKEKLRKEGAADVKLATLLFKPESLKCDLKPDYVGIQIPADFIVGYGLDFDGLGRSFRDIYKIVEA